MNALVAVLLDNQALPRTETFTYLGSIVRQDGERTEERHESFFESVCRLEVITVQHQD